MNTYAGRLLRRRPSTSLHSIEDPGVVFTGPSQPHHPQTPEDSSPRNAIVVYLGNGSISYSRQLSVLTEAFQGGPYQVYIASYQAVSADMDNIHVARRFDFKMLLPCAAAFINHGGQNSILSGIMAGVQQIVFPGNVFERQYNALSIEKLGPGKSCRDEAFNPSAIQQVLQESQELPGFAAGIKHIQSQLTRLGGVERAIESISLLCHMPVEKV